MLYITYGMPAAMVRDEALAEIENVIQSLRFNE